MSESLNLNRNRDSVEQLSSYEPSSLNLNFAPSLSPGEPESATGNIGRGRGFIRLALFELLAARGRP